MKKNRIFLFGISYVIFQTTLFVFLVVSGIVCFCLSFVFKGTLGVGIVLAVFAIIIGLCLWFGPNTAYIYKTNNYMEVCTIFGKKLKECFIGDFYEAKVRRFYDRYDEGFKYVCLYFSEAASRKTNELRFFREFWDMQDAIPVICNEKSLKWSRETLGEEVWKEKYKGT